MAERPWNTLTEADKAEFWACLALKYTPTIGPRTIVRLLKCFGSAFSALEHKNDWSLAKVSPEKARLVASENWRSLALVEWKNAQLCQASLLLWSHEAYPLSLRSLVDAPAFLYCRGDMSLLMAPSFAIVGSRQCSSEGVQVAGTIARELSQAGICIVSGMAQGIDRVAHLAALSHVGKSIGVLGTGIDVVYPQQNKDIYHSLGQQGLLITEFAPTVEPVASHFPTRNRLVSGLCLGVLVVEGMLNSGSLITARLALEQNREVYAIPGAATAAISRGCQELIRQGAKAVFNSEDILYDLAALLQDFSQKTSNTPSALEKEEILQEEGVVQKQYTETQKDIAAKVSFSKGRAHKKQYVKMQKNSDCSILSEKKLEKGARVNTVSTDSVKDEASDLSKTCMLAELSAEEQKRAQEILLILHSKGECHIDTLCQELHESVAHVTILLIEMELACMVQKLPGARYIALCAQGHETRRP